MKETLERAVSLEREAQRFRTERKIDEAFTAYDEAGRLYRAEGEHLKAALCFASAATCWNIHTGHEPLRNAASRSQWAAREALEAGHYDYARGLFREAALLYEKEGDTENYSACFWDSQAAEGKQMWALFFHGREAGGSEPASVSVSGPIRVRALFRWAANVTSRFVWGYGERPFRTLAFALGVILACAFVYGVSGRIAVSGGLREISFLEGLYLSVSTFSTVGYGDYVPLGWARLFAMGEGLSGIFLMPLFLVALTRRYLRLYR